MICAHRSQVGMVTEALGRDLARLHVATADRMQGLQYRVALMYHPLSGRLEADAFHILAGRICVMLTRHKIACVVVDREGWRRRSRPVGATCSNSVPVESRFRDSTGTVISYRQSISAHSHL